MPMSENESDDDKVVDLGQARKRIEPIKKEQAAKDLRKQFHKAMGWNNWPKKKKPSSKGPKGRGGKGKK